MSTGEKLGEGSMTGLTLNTVTTTDTVTSNLLGNMFSKWSKSLFQQCLFLQVLLVLPLNKWCLISLGTLLLSVVFSVFLLV